jgi:hypothetical protein
MIKFFTRLTKTRIVFGLIPAHQVHNKAAPAFEWRSAHFAAWVRGEQSKKMIAITADWLALGQHFVPLFLKCWFRGHHFLQK